MVLGIGLALGLGALRRHRRNQEIKEESARRQKELLSKSALQGNPAAIAIYAGDPAVTAKDFGKEAAAQVQPIFQALHRQNVIEQRASLQHAKDVQTVINAPVPFQPQAPEIGPQPEGILPRTAVPFRRGVQPTEAPSAQTRIARRGRIEKAGAIEQERAKQEGRTEQIQRILGGVGTGAPSQRPRQFAPGQEQIPDVQAPPPQQFQQVQPPAEGQLFQPSFTPQSITVSDDGVSVRLGPTSSPTEQAVAQVQQVIARNPAQLDEALNQLAQQGITLSPPQQEALRGVATRTLFTQVAAQLRAQNPGVSDFEVNRQAFLITAQQLGGQFSSEEIEAITGVLSDPAQTAAAKRTAEIVADQLSETTNLAEDVADIQARRKAEEVALIEKERGQIEQQQGLERRALIRAEALAPAIAVFSNLKGLIPKIGLRKQSAGFLGLPAIWNAVKVYTRIRERDPTQGQAALDYQRTKRNFLTMVRRAAGDNRIAVTDLKEVHAAMPGFVDTERSAIKSLEHAEALFRQVASSHPDVVRQLAGLMQDIDITKNIQLTDQEVRQQFADLPQRAQDQLFQEARDSLAANADRRAIINKAIQLLKER